MQRGEYSRTAKVRSGVGSEQTAHSEWKVTPTFAMSVCLTQILHIAKNYLDLHFIKR